MYLCVCVCVCVSAGWLSMCYPWHSGSAYVRGGYPTTNGNYKRLDQFLDEGQDQHDHRNDDGNSFHKLRDPARRVDKLALTVDSP